MEEKEFDDRMKKIDVCVNDVFLLYGRGTRFVLVF